MTRAQRRTHLIVWLVLGPGAIGAIVLLAVVGPAPAGARSPGAGAAP